MANKRHWDGTPVDEAEARRGARRNMYVHKASASRTLREDAVKRCLYCNHPIDWYQRYDNDEWLPLLLREFPARLVKEYRRWTVFNGVAYLADDGTGRCRIAHPAICPALEDEHDDDPSLRNLRRRYAVYTRTWIDKGEFVPAERRVSETDVCEQYVQADSEVRHVVSYAPFTLLAPAAVDKIQCIARAATTNERCRNLIFEPGLHQGHWTQIEIPIPPGRSGRATLWSDQKMWIYDLNALWPEEWRRWRSQRCTSHESSSAPNTTMEEWLVFDAWRHHKFILCDRPEDLHKRERGDAAGWGLLKPAKAEYKCANCSNRSYAPQDKEWLCWKCVPAAARREKTHEKWQNEPPPPPF
ncbi:DUF6083 domain-containing protein [Streptomyces sp. NPDC056244]|uniref:DUF6083 domain-containing protein n=1 Tax=Streptomyces sp. NPDC056244 TaxID=3345762 RepID=UPI0035DD62CA